jgi:thymidylate synthase (FAD)
MQVLDKGEIGLLDSMGNDHRIAEAAWVSYGNQEQDKPIEGVINYMMKHRHGSPFEHVVFTFYVKAPIFVAREWFRHRIGSFNEISGRYVTLEPEFYIPERFRVKEKTNKQGSIEPSQEWIEEHNYINYDEFDEKSAAILTNAYEIAYYCYEEMLKAGVANEIARAVVPVGMYTQWYWTVNLRSLFNFIGLRNAPNAQQEIQVYARAIEDILKERVPVAYQAFVDNNRIAP